MSNKITKENVMPKEKKPPEEAKIEVEFEETPDEETKGKKKYRTGILGIDSDDFKVLKVKLEDAKEVGKAIKDSLTSRDNVVMVRVNDDSREKMDMLIDAGLFKSRSECAAFLIHQGIAAQEPLFGQMKQKVEKIQKIRDELKDLLNVPDE